jgi:putative endonuclease
VTGKGARYTRMNPPERLLARRAYPDHRSAAQAELAIKQLSCLEKWRWAAACALGIDPSSAVSGPIKRPPSVGDPAHP